MKKIKRKTIIKSTHPKPREQSNSQMLEYVRKNNLKTLEDCRHKVCMCVCTNWLNKR